MKTLFTLFVAFIAATAQSQTIAELAKQKNAQALPASSSPGWYENARQNIREQECHIQWNKDLRQ
jgi:hypothetical protein